MRKQIYLVCPQNKDHKSVDWLTVFLNCGVLILLTQFCVFDVCFRFFLVILRNDSLADSTGVEKGKERKKKNCHIYIRDLNSYRDIADRYTTGLERVRLVKKFILIFRALSDILRTIFVIRSLGVSSSVRKARTPYSKFGRITISRRRCQPNKANR